MSDVKPLSAASFWLGKCLDCAHPAHPVRTCHEMVANGDPSNGPAYCRCSAEMEAMEIALLDAERSALGESADWPTEPCPTCMQPVPVPQRGDHDYGLPLVPLAMTPDARRG